MATRKISIRLDEALVSRLEGLRKNGDTMTDLVDRYVRIGLSEPVHFMETGPAMVTERVKESDGTPPNFIGKIIHKHIPEAAPEDKFEAVPITNNTTVIDKPAIKTAWLRKRRGLAYNEKLEPYFNTLFQDGN